MVADNTVVSGDGLRNRAEVIIIKDGHILVCYGRTPTGEVFYSLPGGGIDPGETPAVAVKRECKEEVGIVISEPVMYQEVVMGAAIATKPGHFNTFKGAKTYLFVAEFDYHDQSLRGSEGDSTPFEWVSPNVAVERFLKGNEFQKGVLISRAIRQAPIVVAKTAGWR